MAARKTTTKKATTVAETPATQPAETITKRTFKDDDKIMCRSITQGPLYMDGVRTKEFYEWLDYGDEIPVKYADLVAAVKIRSQFVFAPYFIITDEDFCAEFPQLEKFYNERFTIKELKSILDLDIQEMIEAIEQLPVGAKESLKAIASDEVQNGVLDSVRKIKALDNIFGTDLNLLADLFQQ